MDDYTYKSPEKSSPSFPEDVDDDDDEERQENSFISYNCTPSELCDAPADSSPDNLATDITMTAEDEDLDDLDANKHTASCVDSPKHNGESSDKKVHWTTRNVQALLDCVEEHLHEFNVQKKHKAVWQAIGVEMEPLGFSTEHCYNKWKNLRRDVRLLVNNPLKAVRNASVLRRVARLILVIYPNVDATTMQVCGDRSGIKSTPTTPGGPCNSVKLNIPDMHYSGMNSPHIKGESPNISRLNGGLYGFSDHLSVHSTPNTVEKGGGRSSKSNSSVPGTALFGGGQQYSVQNGDKDHHSLHQYDQLESQNEDTSRNSSLQFPFPFNPATAALLLQSQLFSEIVKQQRKPDFVTAQDLVQHLTAKQNGSMHSPVQQTLAGFPNDFCAISGVSNASLTASLLNSLVSLTNSTDVRFRIQENFNSTLQNLPPNILEQISPSGEIACVVERLQAEEAVHFRLTDMIVHLADELRAAGQRRQVTLNQLLGLMKSVGIGTSSQNDTADNKSVV